MLRLQWEEQQVWMQTRITFDAKVSKQPIWYYIINKNKVINMQSTFGDYDNNQTFRMYLNG